MQMPNFEERTQRGENKVGFVSTSQSTTKERAERVERIQETCSKG